jgi:midasin (ATPase involved in ribosome maturation)
LELKCANRIKKMTKAKNTMKIIILDPGLNRNCLMFYPILPFFLDINPNGGIKSNDFSFSAPTTKRNLIRVLSALSINKAILLELIPGKNDIFP